MIIDCHGHYTTAPAELGEYREQQKADLATDPLHQHVKGVLAISDEGLGIPKEFQSKVFDKFYRVPTGNVHNVKGFGLGLFYIKSICNAHGWRLHLDSKEGEGTTIRIYIRRPAKVRNWRWTLYHWFPMLKPSALEE